MGLRIVQQVIPGFALPLADARRIEEHYEDGSSYVRIQWAPKPRRPILDASGRTWYLCKFGVRLCTSTAQWCARRRGRAAMVKQAFAAFSVRQCRRDFVRHVQLVRQSLALVA